MGCGACVDTLVLRSRQRLYYTVLAPCFLLFHSISLLLGAIILE